MSWDATTSTMGGDAVDAPIYDRARCLLASWLPLVREILKLLVIGIYLIFATCLLVLHGNPIGFMPLLPWALRSGRSRASGDPAGSGPLTSEEQSQG